MPYRPWFKVSSLAHFLNNAYAKHKKYIFLPIQLFIFGVYFNDEIAVKLLKTKPKQKPAIKLHTPGSQWPLVFNVSLKT